MADTSVLVEEQIQQQQPRPGEITVSHEQLAGSMFGVQTEQPKTEEHNSEQPKTGQPVVQEQPKTEEQKPSTEQQSEEEILDANEWLKREFNWESEDAAKAEIAELRKLKEVKPNEFKFENEESKRLAEAIAKGDRKTVLNILETQDKIESFLTGEVSKDNAEDIIKLALKLKHKDLSDAEINFKFNKQYALPKQPIQSELESDEDFVGRKLVWEDQVKDIEMTKLIDAKLSRPELEQVKTKLVIPEIQKPEVQQKQLTQEELDAAKRFDEAYLRSVDDSLKGFTGFSVSVKNEAVGLPEISIAYSVMDTEKTSLSQEMKDFVNTGYDANALFANNWVNDDNTLNAKQIAEDRYLLANKDKIFQKLTLDAATKAIEAYVKGKKQININETTQPGTAEMSKGEKKEFDDVRDSFFG